MAAKRKKTPKKVSEAYEEAMVAEGAPVALDLLGFGSTIADLIRGRSPKPAAKPKKRVKKKTRAKTKIKATPKTVRTKKKTAGKSRRKK